MNLFDFNQPITLPIAFLAGVISFFAPCVVPLLPAYISYVTGVTTQSLKEKGIEYYRKKIVISSLFYILGFSIVFVLLGVAASGIGRVFRLHEKELQIIGGLLMIFFGLDILGIINFSFFARERKFTLPKWMEHLGHSKSFLLGIIFAAAWTPCIGPILGSILALAAVSSSSVTGAILLIAYSAGISLPFLVIALSLAQAPKKIKVIKKNIVRISKVAGVILIVIGVTLVFGWYAYINGYVVQWLEAIS